MEWKELRKQLAETKMTTSGGASQVVMNSMHANNVVAHISLGADDDPVEQVASSNILRHFGLLNLSSTSSASTEGRTRRRASLGSTSVDSCSTRESGPAWTPSASQPCSKNERGTKRALTKRFFKKAASDNMEETNNLRCSFEDSFNLENSNDDAAELQRMHQLSKERALQDAGWFFLPNKKSSSTQQRRNSMGPGTVLSYQEAAPTRCELNVTVVPSCRIPFDLAIDCDKESEDIIRPPEAGTKSNVLSSNLEREDSYPACRPPPLLSSADLCDLSNDELNYDEDEDPATGHEQRGSLWELLDATRQRGKSVVAESMHQYGQRRRSLPVRFENNQG
eukprot:CAMPEP_0194048192 /NCGR_PEP_ID=MMETSP0009_2-20130614/26777_1 /TAXON_ID=210454 /ORGANISM="Grammatophora oceanica, Strain CCMP 410" /LENGTH=336 /DNA_ID=CAMNT_0038694007 /DNA_START=110 /DNA_END=1120 /DNA_ORIENTATION=-